MRQHRLLSPPAAVLALVGLGSCGPLDPAPEPISVDSIAAATTPQYRVLVANDLGMHCYDSDYSVLSLLPPFNNLHAQVVDRTNQALLTSAQVTLRYSGIADPAGNLNLTSKGKTNFWTYVKPLYGATLAVDQGLVGQNMPGATNTPQTFKKYDATRKWFAAEGIPVTSFSDKGATDYYPMFRVQAVSKATGAVLGSTDVVAPVSNEMHCAACHNTGGTAARAAGAVWSTNTNADLQYRENILKLHDLRHSTSLFASRPVLCASCHYSPALDLAGAGPQGNQVGKSYLSHSIHTRHGKDLTGGTTGAPIVANTKDGCYQCHPGSATRCLRGAMGNGGVSCQDCHGGMLSVGGYYAAAGSKRTPWLSEPGCQSCHTGDAVTHQTVSGIMAADGIRLTKAFTTGDRLATPRAAPASRFGEGSSLYKLGLGHKGVFCQACHNSTHAEWPSSETNDNLTAQQIQGHGGVIAECTACHATVPMTATGGPHGMHTVGAAWVSGHERYAEGKQSTCQPCHGADYRGTVLSRTAAARTFTVEGRTVSFAARQAVGCYSCHNGPSGG